MPLWKYDLDIKYKVKHVIKSYIYIRFANLTPHTRTHAHAHATRARARAHTHTHTRHTGYNLFFCKIHHSKNDETISDTISVLYKLHLTVNSNYCNRIVMNRY